MTDPDALDEPDPTRPPTPRPRTLSLGQPTQLADRVFTLVAEPASVTIGVIAGDDGAVVVDTGSAPSQGAAIRALAAELTGLPVVAAVVTHPHVDHAFGLAAFADLITIGHESLGGLIPGSAAATRAAAEFGFEPAELAVPNRPIVLATALDLGGRRIEVAHLGRGHTAADLLVVVPDADLVFTGDLIESATPPWYGPDSVPMEWAATLDGLIGLLTENSRAVPGHGPVVDREFVFEQRGQIAAVAFELARVAAAGLSVEEALAQGDWPFPAEHLEEAVRRSVAEAGERPGPDAGRRQLPLV